MPHRVANFFRSSTQSLENQVSSRTKSAASGAAWRRDSPSRVRGDLRPLARTTSHSLVEGESDDADAPPYVPRVKMADSRASSHDSPKESKEHSHHHRISFPGLHLGRSGKDHHGNAGASLDWQLESPPIVMYNCAESSSGALLSGQLFLHVKEDLLEFETLYATLNIHVVQKKPFISHCADCTHQYTELKRWDLLQHPLVLGKGRHSFPFSVLLEGHLPASMDGPLMSIAYEFKAEAVPRSQHGSSSSPLKLEKVLEVKRSLATSETPHHSVRVFPPTNIKASAHYPHVIHPIGTYTLALRLDGIAKHNVRADTIEYWKLKKLTWRLEETAKTVAPACGRHSPKTVEGGEEHQRKGIVRNDTRVIGEKTLFSGWKANYSSPTDSCVELELDYSLAKHARSACDTKSRDGTEVTHQLMVEMVVSQEWAPVKKPSLVTHTGVGRILRMHFGTILTERGGIGISWDNEAPPIYQDVPPSPPAYSQQTRFVGDGSIDELIEPLDEASGEATEPHASEHGRASFEER